MSSRTILLQALMALAAGTLVPAAAAVAGPTPCAAPTPGQTFLTMEEALELAFPDCEITRETRYLDKKAQKAIGKALGEDFKTGVIHAYAATKDGKQVGTAYFDSHRVRTLREVLMVVVAPDDTIRRVEVLAFCEPREYLPKGAWYEQFQGRALDEDLSLKRKIRGVTGATLTATATTACARRVLTVHQHLQAPKDGRAIGTTAKAGDGRP